MVAGLGVPIFRVFTVYVYLKYEKNSSICNYPETYLLIKSTG